MSKTLDLSSPEPLKPVSPNPRGVEARRLLDFIEAKNVTEDEFVRLNPSPVLLVLPMLGESQSQQTTSASSTNFSVKASTVVALDLAKLGRQDLQVVQAYVLRKDRTRFGEAIWIGRWSKCDVAIELNTLSRLHAFITYDNDGTVYLGDGGSKNGTYVSGKLVPKGVTVALPEDAYLTLGTLSVRFLQPRPFFRELQVMFKRIT
jgi:hypothetical protein